MSPENGVTIVTRLPFPTIPRAGEFLRVLRVSVRPAEKDGWYDMTLQVERLQEVDPPETATPERVQWLVEGGPYAPV